ncbi:MAG: hypothetical protein PHT40_01840 [Patescibacteria group bacterium]|nr:hypothetical protein [Patescibacteria group bacterium]
MANKEKKEKKVETTGFVILPETHPTRFFKSRPATSEPICDGSDFFNFGKCEPEIVATRFANIQIRAKLPNWSGMSVKRFFFGTEKMGWWKKVPHLIPVLTEKEEDGPAVEIFPSPPGREYLFYICDLRRLERLGLLEFFEIDGEHYIIPTAKFVLAYEQGVFKVNQMIAAQKNYQKRQRAAKKCA